MCEWMCAIGMCANGTLPFQVPVAIMSIILNEMLMAMITLVIQARNQPMRYREITMQKVTKLFYIYSCYKELDEG